MNKSGQVTIFIIIAILIVGVVALFFSFRGNLVKEETYTPETASIKNFVDECLYDSGENALYFVGQHGGYYIPPNPSTPLGVPYYIINNKTFFPSKEKISKEISKYIDEALPLCTNNFTNFKNFSIKEGKIKTKTIILEDKVILEVNYPLAITRGESVISIEKFENIEIPVRLGKIYNTINFIIEQQLKNSGEICLSCLLNLQEKNEIYIIIKSEEETLVYYVVDPLSLSDKKNVLEPEQYSFRFAVEY